MKLPWDKKYIKIAFHVVVAVILMYALKLCVDFIAYTITNLGEIFDGISSIVGWMFSVCSTLVIAFVVAYVFDPVVDFFQCKYDIVIKKYVLPKIKENDSLKSLLIRSRVKKRIKINKNDNRIVFKKRTAGTVITFLIIIFILYIGLSFLVNKISESGGDNMVESVIAFINNSFSDFSGTYAKLEDLLKDYGVFEYVQQYVDSFISEFTGFISNIANGIVGFIYSFGSGFLNVLIGFVISFYFMRDKEAILYKFNEVFKAFLPHRFNSTLGNVLSDIDAVFSGYIRGQVIDASIMSVLISVGLLLIDVDFAVIIGIVSGFANIIPYFGAFIAFVLAIAVTLLSGTPIKALYAAIIIVILQQLDGIVIGPKVVGESVKLSPVLVIIALTVAAELFGLWGMIFAVPMFATVKLFAQRFYYRQKMKKNFADSFPEKL